MTEEQFRLPSVRKLIDQHLTQLYQDQKISIVPFIVTVGVQQQTLRLSKTINNKEDVYICIFLNMIEEYIRVKY